MTLERFKQYRDQKNELQQLKADITRAQLKMHRITTDSVLGSMPEHHMWSIRWLSGVLMLNMRIPFAAASPLWRIASCGRS